MIIVAEAALYRVGADDVRSTVEREMGMAVFVPLLVLSGIAIELLFSKDLRGKREDGVRKG